MRRHEATAQPHEIRLGGRQGIRTPVIAPVEQTLVRGALVIIGLMEPVRNPPGESGDRW